VKLSPRDPLPLAQIAQSWYYLGYFRKALKYAEKALDLKKDNQDVYGIDIGLLTLTGRLDEAERAISNLQMIYEADKFADDPEIADRRPCVRAGERLTYSRPAVPGQPPQALTSIWRWA
jgi:tetratricopeptide (TPR) repeat protein